jgi:hypothetical protein
MTFLGSLHNQEYEARINIKNHSKAVKETPASNETVRWRKMEETHVNTLNQNKVIRDKILHSNLEHYNTEMANRLYYVMTEDRVTNTTEFKPGWRIGRKGLYGYIY